MLVPSKCDLHGATPLSQGRRFGVTHGSLTARTLASSSSRRDVARLNGNGVRQWPCLRSLQVAILNRPWIRLTLLVVVLLYWGALAAPTMADDSADLYLSSIKPLLRKSCYACHGGLKQEADLRLDTVSAIHQAGILDFEEPELSELFLRVQSEDVTHRMPPEHEGEPLTEQQVGQILDWIRKGAAGPADEQPEADPSTHWAFQPIRRPELPAWTSDQPIHPIDALIEASRRQHSLQPQPEASRLELVRRLYFDLLGVPPSLSELEQALQDPSPQWYEQLVDTLLSDPRYGQRWGRHWMDVWRYSDWWGLNEQLRNSQKNLWHWRDWIIESLNEDQSYAEMLRCMLAADELYPEDLSKIRATGYLARNFFLFNRNPWMDETIEHVGKGFLGLTFNCAKCHDHKYDPISQLDYYRLRAFFEPYHVRNDLLPGAHDIDRQGVPRVFDAAIDAPTYLFIRGDEATPDRSTVVQADIPSFLSTSALHIEPLTLPPVSYEPERRLGIVAGLAQRSEHELLESRQEKERLQARLDELGKKVEAFEQRAASTANDASRAWQEVLPQLERPQWQFHGVGWASNETELRQTQDGMVRSLVRFNDSIANDFEARLRFRIEGGSRWRSVGIGFNVPAPLTNESVDSMDEVQVYLSAHEGGPKIQAAYRQSDGWIYPSEGARNLTVPLNTDIELLVRVRGDLLNAYVDGVPRLAWRIPVDRKTGSVQLTTFDAIATFTKFQVTALQPDLDVYPPSEFSQAPPLTLEALRTQLHQQANDVQRAALLESVARHAHQEVQARADAWRSIWDRHSDTQQSLQIMKAKRAELYLEQARLQLQWFNLELQNETQSEEGQKLAQAMQELANRLQDESLNTEAHASTLKPFQASKWSATRFLHSGRDDPALEFPHESTGRRSALAHWITSNSNPLTARVAVNHIWTRHMNRPIVDSVFDFGRNGTPPTHPELLDWLASEFQDSNWSMKHIHRLIVTSHTYRLSSSLKDADPATVAADPDNRYWWHAEARRLESQAVRDSLLQLGGRLDHALGGPTIPKEEQASSTRRSLYFFHSNNDRNSFLTTFDEASVKDCYRREMSIVPQQALALANSPLALQSAATIATNISDSASSNEEFVEIAFAFVLGMNPTEQDRQACIDALRDWQRSYDSDGLAETPSAESMANARQQLVWVLLNHHDFVTVR